MLIQFSVTNFRSIKSRQTLYMTAAGGKKIPDNFFTPSSYPTIKLLKTVGIFGGNASGKSNIIRAFFNIRREILMSTNNKTGEPIRAYKPFLLDEESNKKPTIFEIDFIGIDKIKYNYFVSLNKKRVILERMYFYPNNKRNLLFERHHKTGIRLGQKFESQTIDKNLNPNHLFLTKAGNAGLKQMSKLYIYFKNTEVRNTLSTAHLSECRKKVMELLADEKNDPFRAKMNKLISYADTKIEHVNIKKLSKDDFPDDLSEDDKIKLLDKFEFRITAIHEKYSKGVKIGEEAFSFNEESSGTDALLIIGGLILDNIRKGSVLFVDEINNSLHSELCRFLIECHQDKNFNNKNAQLIFVAHDISLMDKNLFRKDQLFITEKSIFGETKLFSLSDFDGLRDEVDFGRWYLNGRFGGLPKIKKSPFFTFVDD